MNWVIIVEMISSIGAILIVAQLYQFRRSQKYETCQHLFQAFSAGQLYEYRKRVRDQLYSDNRGNLLDAIGDPAGADPDHSRLAAEQMNSFLSYVYYTVDEGLVHPRDVAQIMGRWLKVNSDLESSLRAEGRFSSDRIDALFPKVPGRLCRELERARFMTFIGTLDPTNMTED